MTTKPQSHWFTQSAVDEITAGLRATLEDRTAALTRTIAKNDALRSEVEWAHVQTDAAVAEMKAAEAALADLRAKVAALSEEWEHAAERGEDEPYGRIIGRTLLGVAGDLKDALKPTPSCGSGGCCADCEGTGFANDGMCWDCRGTGHPHDLRAVLEGGR